MNTTFGKLKRGDIFFFEDDIKTLCKKTSQTKYVYIGQGWEHSANKNDKVIKPQIEEGIKMKKLQVETTRMRELAGMIKEVDYKISQMTDIGEPTVESVLNQALKRELTVISQYIVHSELCSNWGYTKLAGTIKTQAIGEMKHAEALIERIIFLDGTPEVGYLNPIKIGSDVSSMLEFDMNAEAEAIDLYNNGIDVCTDEGDSGSRELLEQFLKDEEAHYDWLRSQLDQIEQMGIENYLSTQI